MQKLVICEVMAMYISVLNSVICIDDIIVRVIESSLFCIIVFHLTYTL